MAHALLDLQIPRGNSLEHTNTTQNLTANSKTQPETQEPALVVRFRIRERNRRFGHPKDARRDTTQGRPKESKPLDSEPIVGVQASRVRCIPHRSKDKGPFDANETDDDAAEAAGDNHQAERESIRAVDQVRFLFTAGAERVHR